MSGVFQNIDHPPPPPGECVPPCLWCGGRTHSLGGVGVGGQYFGRRQTQLCTLHMQVLCAWSACHNLYKEGTAVYKKESARVPLGPSLIIGTLAST
jgi:hypothetical protein